MPERICTCCDEPHATRDWYVINEFKHPLRGRVECRAAHEDRVRREVADAYHAPSAKSCTSRDP